MIVRQPPTAIDAEQAVLGACLYSSKAVETVLTDLRAEEFFNEGHRNIYRAMETLHSAQQTIDPVTLGEAMRQAGTLPSIGDNTSYLYLLIEKVPTATLVGYYIEPVADRAMRRSLIEFGEFLINAAHDSEEAADVIAVNGAAILASMESHKSNWESIPAQVAFSAQREELKARTAPPLVRIHQADIDDELKIHPGDLIVVAGIFNTGKSAAVLDWLLSATKRGVVTDLLTLEMSRRQCEDRMLASLSNTNATRIAERRLSDEELEHVLPWNEYLERLPLHITERGVPHVEAMRSLLRESSRERGTKLVIIDQLSHIGTRGKHENDTLKLGYISRQLKASAQENNNGVILLCQLNRTSDLTQRPQTSQLRGSGMIAELADAVVLVHRPERKKNALAGEREPDECPFEIIVDRQRNGPTGGIVKRTFRRSTQKLFDWSTQFDDDDTPPDTGRKDWFG